MMRRVALPIASIATVMCLVQVADGQAPGEPLPNAEPCSVDDKACLTIIGQDGYNDIDWDGPDIVARSLLDFPCFDVGVELDKFGAATAGIASRVPARTLTYAQALAAVRQSMASGDAEKVVSDLRKRATTPAGSVALEKLGVFAAVRGDPSFTLATLLTRHEAAPNDATVLFNFAGALTQAGLPNEAIAMLDRIASRDARPDIAFGFRPDAALDYLRGYAYLMVGKLNESRSLLSRAFAADKTLTDASYALAIAEQALGGDPRKPMLQGALPVFSGTLMYCGDHYDVDPLARREEEEVGPEADDVLDLSKGTPGVLPQLRHPNSGERLVRMVEEMGKEAQKLLDEALFFDRRASEIYVKQLGPRLERPSPKAQDLIDQALFDMINESKASLRPLQRMRVAREKRHEEMTEAMERDIDAQRDKLMRLLQMGDSLTEPYKALARDIVSTGMNRRRTSINGWDTALRQHFRAWHRYATGVAGHMTDDTWREYADLSIKGARATLWHSLYVGVIVGYFAQLPASAVIYDAGPPLSRPPGQQADPLWRCSEAAQKSAIKTKLIGDDAMLIASNALPTMPGAGFELSMEVNCDKASLEIDGKVTELDIGSIKLGMGGFLEGSWERSGDITIYGGPKASLVVGPIFQGEIKDGMAITFDSDGNLKEIALRVDPTLALEGAGGKRDLTAASRTPLKSYDPDSASKFTIWAAPPRPPKFDAATGLSVWPNVR
jgi:tetratricopeptide (TPR) repeat protein